MQRFFSGFAMEAEAGYCRAVAAGDFLHISGTTGPEEDGSYAEDPARQAERAFEIIQKVLDEAGFRREQIVRVVYYVTDRAYFPALLPLGKAFFGDGVPAATGLVCGLVDPRMKVEIEVTAQKA